MTLSSFPMTSAIFHDFPGLENGLPKFHDFPLPGGTLIKAALSFRTIPRRACFTQCLSVVLSVC